jgi:rhodanese-related sulfurtransferase
MNTKNKNIKVSLSLMAISIILLFASCKANSNDSLINETINVDAFASKLDTIKNFILLDVRTPEEFKEGHLANALNINYNDANFGSEVGKLDKSKSVLIYCLSGGRSSGAATEMSKSGFKVIYNLKGGIMAWRNANQPISAFQQNIKSGYSESDFIKLVNNEKFVLVDFNAKWCKPCKAMMPMIDKLAKEKSEKLILLKVDADANQELMKVKHIEMIPYFELYKNGKLIWHHRGSISRDQLLAETKL